jgi:osmoprotectant transport system ATP-binding protein
MLELVRAGKSYNGAAALHPTDLAIPLGRTTVLLGPSGCGKSTLLRLLAGLISPDTGEVRLHGQAMTPASARQMRRRIGFVVQEGGLFPHLTARENATLMAGQLGWPAADILRRLDELTALTHLPGDALNRYPVELSGGQRQRVSLIRALFLDPELVLLDEPLGALDPMIRSDLQADLREIFRSLGKTAVVVTHDLAEAAYLGDELVLMREGRIVQKGSPEDLTDRPSDPFVSRFVRAQRMMAGGPRP